MSIFRRVERVSSLSSAQTKSTTAIYLHPGRAERTECSIFNSLTSPPLSSPSSPSSNRNRNQNQNQNLTHTLGSKKDKFIIPSTWHSHSRTCHSLPTAASSLHPIPSHLLCITHIHPSIPDRRPCNTIISSPSHYCHIQETLVNNNNNSNSNNNSRMKAPN